MNNKPSKAVHQPPTARQSNPKKAKLPLMARRGTGKPDFRIVLRITKTPQAAGDTLHNLSSSALEDIVLEGQAGDNPFSWLENWDAGHADAGPDWSADQLNGANGEVTGTDDVADHYPAPAPLDVGGWALARSAAFEILQIARAFFASCYDAETHRLVRWTGEEMIALAVFILVVTHVFVPVFIAVYRAVMTPVAAAATFFENRVTKPLASRVPAGPIAVMWVVVLVIITSWIYLLTFRVTAWILHSWFAVWTCYMDTESDLNTCAINQGAQPSSPWQADQLRARFVHFCDRAEELIPQAVLVRAVWRAAREAWDLTHWSSALVPTWSSYPSASGVVLPAFKFEYPSLIGGVAPKGKTFIAKAAFKKGKSSGGKGKGDSLKPPKSKAKGDVGPADPVDDGAVGGAGPPPEEPVPDGEILGEMAKLLATVMSYEHSKKLTTFDGVYSLREAAFQITQSSFLETGNSPMCGPIALAAGLVVKPDAAFLSEGLAVAASFMGLPAIRAQANCVGLLNDDAADVARVMPGILGLDYVLGAWTNRHARNLAIFVKDDEGVPQLNSTYVHHTNSPWLVFFYSGPQDGGGIGHYQLVVRDVHDLRPRSPVFAESGFAFVHVPHDASGFRVFSSATKVGWQDVDLWCVFDMLMTLLCSLASGLFFFRFGSMWRSSYGWMKLHRCTERRNPRDAAVGTDVQDDMHLTEDSTWHLELEYHCFLSARFMMDLPLSAYYSSAYVLGIRNAEALGRAAEQGLGNFSYNAMSTSGVGGAAALGRSSHVRTPENVRFCNPAIPSMINIFGDTKHTLARPPGGWAEDQAVVGGPLGAPLNPGGRLNGWKRVVSWPAPIEKFFCKPDSLDAAEANQAAGLRGHKVNHLKTRKTRKKRFYQAPVRPSAVALFGVAVVGATLCGIGAFCATNVMGMAACGVGRSMATPTHDPDVLQRYLDFVPGEIEHLCDNEELRVACSDLHEDPTPTNAYREIYAGKRSARSIAADISAWDAYHDGSLQGPARAKFERRGQFVKNEANSKKGLSRPRGIGVMSPKQLISGCQVTRLFHAFNHTVGRSFQTKGETPEEACRRIESLTSRRYTMTDYSAFEASQFASKRRAVEVALVHKLCDMAGFRATKKACDEIMADTAELWWHELCLVVESRVSGHFETSTANGLQNLLAIRFDWTEDRIARGLSIDRAIKRPECVVEGDDAICSHTLDEERMRGIGLVYSAAMTGYLPGETDFLSVGYVGGDKYPDVFKTCNKLLWLVNDGSLKESKLKFLARAKAYSCWLMYGDHPIIGAMVVKIGELTAGSSYFKGAEFHVNAWKNETVKIENFPRRSSPSHARRVVVANGVGGYPPISIAVQEACEACIRKGDWSFFTFIDDQPSADEFIRSASWLTGPATVLASRTNANSTVAYERLIEIVRSAGIVGIEDFERRTVFRPWDDYVP